jgi:tRNA (cytidine32/guanosine34-2'-O)-methyltransferase
LVLCDGAPDICGFHDMDQYIQSHLLVAALNIATKLLTVGGAFVAKVFKGSECGFLYSQCKYYFGEIHIVKPDSSRSSSVEHFLVGLHFHGGEPNVAALQLSTFASHQPQLSPQSNELKVFKFVTCGDLSEFDAPQPTESTSSL